MIRYRLTLTKEKDGVIDKDFTIKAEYVSWYEPALNMDPECVIVEHLTEMLLECFLKGKDPVNLFGDLEKCRETLEKEDCK